MTTITENNRAELTARKMNPFGVSNAKREQLLQAQRNKNLYQDLSERAEPTLAPPVQEQIKSAINKLLVRTENKKFKTEHFGRIEYIPLSELYINIDNQRDVDWDHVAHIIETFDPRAVQVVNTIKLPDGRYSVPEGQHTAIVLYILFTMGIIGKDFMVQCKVVEALTTVPGSDLTGEAFGNYLFRLINYKGRKAVEPYFMHKSRVSGVRNYNSKLTEDIHAERIQSVVEKNNMFTRPAIEARGQGALPGMVTYITGLNKVAGLETDEFDASINDLDFALELHNKHFAYEKGVDGGFILAFGRYAALARRSKIDITHDWREALVRFFKETYASPKKFHTTCKNRLEKFNKAHDLPGGWSDNCLLSVLILDFYNWCEANGESYPVLDDKNINKYNGI